MEYKIATIHDIEDVLKLQNKYHIDTILKEDKVDGFVTTLFSKEDLEQLITQERGLHIAVENNQVIAYVMAASWQYWSSWPFFRHMIKGLENLKYIGLELNVNNSYQYGPICIDKKYRGTRVLEEIYSFSINEMAKRYPVLVTFINKTNPRSYKAHVEKLKLDVIDEFEFNNNHYYELVDDTSRK